MKESILIFIMLALVFVVGFGFPAGTKEAGADAVAGSNSEGCYLGVFREGAPANMGFIKNFEKSFNKKPAIVMWYIDYSYDFPVNDCKKVSSYGAIPHIVWEPWVWGEEDKINIDNIINGEYDSYIRKWAKDAKEYGKPVQLRWGHEFNIQKYPWGVPNNGSDPKKYINAYKHVHDIFRSEGADNVKWVWCFNNYSEPDTVWNEPEKAYPGDEYVDWIGIDGYNWGSTQSWSGWETFKVLFRDKVRAAAKLHPTKPIMIAEFGSAEDIDDASKKAKWVKEIPGVLKVSMKQVKTVILFDVKKECDWRTNSSSITENAYKEIFKDPLFLSNAKELAELKVMPEIFSPKKATAKYADRSVVIGGELDQWSSADPVVLSGREFLREGESWNGNNDVSAKVYLKWDNDYLYVAADVVDDMPLCNSKKNGDIWNGDAVEIAISTDPSLPQNREYMSDRDYQIGFGTGDGGTNPPSIWIWQNKRSPKGGAIKVVRKVSPQGYVLEAKVPWTELGGFKPDSGVTVGFNVAVEDADARFEREAQLVWCGDYAFYRDPSVWGRLEFVR